jgi:hypothetical protein
LEQVDYLLFDEALITNKGFLFKENYYSCPIAVRNQIFNSINCNEGIRVEVFYSPFLKDKILIKLEEWRLCFAYLVKERTLMDDEEIEEFHKQIQILKRKYQLSRKGNIQRIVNYEDDNCS